MVPIAYSVLFFTMILTVQALPPYEHWRKRYQDILPKLGVDWSDKKLTGRAKR